MPTEFAAPLIVALLAGTLAFAQEKDLRLVEITASPEDEATARVKNGLVEALTASRELTLSTGQKPGTLMISFPKPVEVRAHMGRTEYLYRVEFRAVNGRLFEGGTGSCWSDEIARCVFNVVRTASRVAPRQ